MLRREIEGAPERHFFHRHAPGVLALPGALRIPPSERPELCLAHRHVRTRHSVEPRAHRFHHLAPHRAPEPRKPRFWQWVAVDDGSRRLGIRGDRAGGVAQVQRHRFDTLIVGVVEHCDVHRLLRFTRRENECARRGLVVLARRCRAVRCRVVHRHRVRSRAAQCHDKWQSCARSLIDPSVGHCEDDLALNAGAAALGNNRTVLIVTVVIRGGPVPVPGTVVGPHTEPALVVLGQARVQAADLTRAGDAEAYMRIEDEPAVLRRREHVVRRYVQLVADHRVVVGLGDVPTDIDPFVDG